MRQAHGTTISVVFNSLPTDYGAFFGDLFPALQQAAADVSIWPTIDLWE
jgi:hypothetical protein